MTVREIVQSFYDGLAQKNNRWQENLAEDVVFSNAGGQLAAEGKASFIQAFTPFLRSVEKVQVKQLIVEGPDAAAVVGYDYLSATGTRFHQDDAEVWKVEGGNIVALTLYFDITEFRTLMGR